jgi:hypothetical protein
MVFNRTVVICQFQMTLFDTAPESVSDGLFDGGDKPPWDIWIAIPFGETSQESGHLEAQLICWVPNAWLELAEAGIDASPTATNQWLREMNNNLAHQLIS